MKYIELTSEIQLEEMDAKSFSQSNGVLVFKHSRRCSISSMAYGRFTRKWDYNEENFPIYYVDVIGQRNVSNAIAGKYDVGHESPQILLIKDGKCSYTASHMAIDPVNLNSILND